MSVRAQSRTIFEIIFYTKEEGCNCARPDNNKESKYEKITIHNNTVI